MPLRLQRSEGVGAIMTRRDRSIQGLMGAVKNPRILILDEATSALDAQSEEAVQSALETLIAGGNCPARSLRLGEAGARPPGPLRAAAP